MDFDFAGFAVWFLVFLFSTTCHEAAHAWVAYRGGDVTAYEGGQVTLDPIPHIRREPFGMILAPVLSFAWWGWLMGWASAPYNPNWGRQYPRRWAVMALAGPAANLGLAILAFALIKILLLTGTFQTPSANFAPTLANFASHLVEPAQDVARGSLLKALAMILSVTLSLNTLLFVFNLLPVLPLDGASVLHGFFPNSLGRMYDAMRGMPMIELLGLLIAWNLFPYVSGPAFSLMLRLVYL